MAKDYAIMSGNRSEIVQFDSSEISSLLNSVTFEINARPVNYLQEEKILNYINSLFNSFNSLKEAWEAAKTTAIQYGETEDSVPNPIPVKSPNSF